MTDTDLRLQSANEWNRLKAVIVGSVRGYSPGLELEQGTISSEAVALAQTAFPKWYLDEVAEDLEDLCTTFRTAGVRVLRPTWPAPSAAITTPFWNASGHDLYNVRDLHIVFDNTLVVSATSSRFRLFETYAFQDLMYSHFYDRGFRWISAPLPKLAGVYRHELPAPRTQLEATEEALHTKLSAGLSEVYHNLDENEIIFDAANIIRLGKDILFLVSSTGNRKAATWLSSVLGPEYRVHLTHTYRSSHLDSTIMPLRDGTVLLNSARVQITSCPELLRKWDCLYFSQVAPVPKSEVDFHRDVRLPVYWKLKEMGYESPLQHISSAWAGLNVMSLDSDTVLVHDLQTDLISLLERKGFTVVPVRMRHCYTMLGGLHCTTLDVMRE